MDLLWLSAHVLAVALVADPVAATPVAAAPVAATPVAPEAPAAPAAPAAPEAAKPAPAAEPEVAPAEVVRIKRDFGKPNFDLVIDAWADVEAARLREVRLFDRYVGPGLEPGSKSLAMGLILQDVSRTLTDHDADQAVADALEALARDCGARLRS